LRQELSSLRCPSPAVGDVGGFRLRSRAGVDRQHEENFDMESIVTPILGILGLEWPQYIAIIALIALIIFYMQYKKRQM
jgi:hypothetical protein